MYDSNCKCFPFMVFLLEQIRTALDIECGVINLTNAFFLLNFQQMEDTGSNFPSLDGTAYTFLTFSEMSELSFHQHISYSTSPRKTDELS